MKEDYCPYSLALKLKRAGFDEPCDHYWYKAYSNSGEMKMRQASADDYNNDDWNVPHCSAPHIYYAQKWLREKKGIDVLVYNCSCGYIWEVSKAGNGTGLIMYNDNGDDKDSGCWTTYEGAISAGLNSALDLLAGKEGTE